MIGSLRPPSWACAAQSQPRGQRFRSQEEEIERAAFREGLSSSIKALQPVPHKAQIDQAINQPEQVAPGDRILEAELF